MARTAQRVGVLLLVSQLFVSTSNACESDCDDQVFCNGLEQCVEGLCSAGAPPEVDDGVACTEDHCDELQGRVRHVPLDWLCSDGLFCNGAERCQPLLGCRPGNPDVIDDAIECTLDRCDEEVDRVVHDPIDALCHDGNECTLDVCDPEIGCTREVRDGPCNDRKECTSEDLCFEGVCVGIPSTCGDGIFGGTCGEECDDGNVLNGDGCNVACRVEGVARLLHRLPVIQATLNQRLRRSGTPIAVRSGLRDASHELGEAISWLGDPNPVQVPHALWRVSQALDRIEGLDVQSQGLSIYVDEMLELSRTVALTRIAAIECLDARCRSDVAHARQRVGRAPGWAERGHFRRAAKLYKDAWSVLTPWP